MPKVFHIATQSSLESNRGVIPQALQSPIANLDGREFACDSARDKQCNSGSPFEVRLLLQ